MLLALLLALPSAAVSLPSRRSARLPRVRASRGLSMTVSLSKQDAAEEAYWRRWFWEQAEEAIEERFASASKRELKRVREYIRANREDEPLPKKLSKNPQYECIGGFFPGLTVTPFLECTGQPWGGLAQAYPAIKRELDALLAREQARSLRPLAASPRCPHLASPRLASPRLASPRASRPLR